MFVNFSEETKHLLKQAEAEKDNLNHPYVGSEHLLLSILKDSKLIKFRREGKVIFYSLDDDHVRTIISMGMEHVEE